MGAEIFEDIILTSKTGVWVDSRAYANLSALVADIGSSAAIVVIARSETVASNLTIPSTYTLLFLGPSSGIVAGDGATVTIQTRDIYGAARVLFSGAGSFDFADGTELQTAWFGTLANTISAAGDSALTLEISAAEVLSSNLVLPLTLFLKWTAPGRELTINEGVTLSGVSKISAGNYPIFVGAGDISFTSGMTVLPEWFNSFREAVDMIDSDPVTLEITGTTLVDLTMSVPATVLTWIKGSGIVSVSDQQTLTFLGTVNTEKGVWYTGLGTVEANTVNDLTKEVVILDTLIAKINEAALSSPIGPAGLVIGATTAYEEGYDVGYISGRAELALATANQAIADAANAQAAADGKIQLWRQSSAPVQEVPPVIFEGDIWIDSDDGKVYIWNGTLEQWDYTVDNTLAEALSTANGAYALAGGKTTAFFESSFEPPTAEQFGDLWYQLDTGLLYIWMATDEEPLGEWVLTVEGIDVVRQDIEPENPTNGLLWYCTDSENQSYYGGLWKWIDGESQWALVGDSTISTIDRGVITTGTIRLADGSGNVKAGITGTTTLGADSDVRIWAGCTLEQARDSEYDAPFKVQQNGHVSMVGATIRSALTGARVEIDPTSGELVVYNSSDSPVFKVIMTGVDVGDVVLGDVSGVHLKWDDSEDELQVVGPVISSANFFDNPITADAENWLFGGVSWPGYSWFELCSVLFDPMADPLNPVQATGFVKLVAHAASIVGGSLASRKVRLIEIDGNQVETVLAESDWGLGGIVNWTWAGTRHFTVLGNTYYKMQVMYATSGSVQVIGNGYLDWLYVRR